MASTMLDVHVLAVDVKLSLAVSTGLQTPMPPIRAGSEKRCCS